MPVMVGESDEEDEDGNEDTNDVKEERLSAEWRSPIYAFFKPMPLVLEIDGRRVHQFVCSAKSCKGRGRDARTVNRYLDTKDARSTSNLRKHAKTCWGIEAIAAADATKDVDAAREVIRMAGGRDGSITAAFERIKKSGAVSYSHRPHTDEETRAEICRWVCEAKRPFKIIGDRALLSS
ncbi:hypothetical protein FPV67DRAFT_1559261 [Lyophyllum atratum]|nr:hypothetical protein FPV67DRAFT_1559261 [Lyophyllum atratum]